MEAKEACAIRPKTKAETERCVLVLFRYMYLKVYGRSYSKKKISLAAACPGDGGRESK